MAARIFFLLALAFIGAESILLGCKTSQLGKEYIGTLAKTKTGKICQAWADQYPHQHTRNTAGGYLFPDGDELQAKNYCRNPDNWEGGPWCYTTDPNSRWEPCDVPLCPNCKTSQLGKEYMGLQAKTKTGKQCQAWAEQYPHQHTRNTAGGYMFPDGDEIQAKNYCRNPDNWEGGPWCYTTDPNSRWESCDILLCPNCKTTQMGMGYMGTASVTKSGLKCQAWGDQYPHKHTRNTAGGYWFPDGNELNAKNYCRNPDMWEGGPWCYTSDPNVRWEACSIALC